MSESWITLGEIAREVGASLSSVSRRAAKFVELGLLTVRSEGRRRLVDRDAYLAADRAVTDGVRRMNGRARHRREPDGGPVRADGDGLSLAREQTRRMRIEADRSQIRLDVELGRLIPVDAVRDGVLKAANGLASGLDRLPHRAVELCGVLKRGGEAGVEKFLREFSDNLRALLAADFANFISGRAITCNDDGNVE